MNKELALRTFGYLIGYYKSHDETTINSDEIDAINFILKDNENLEQEVKKQKEVIDKAIEYIKSNIYEEDNGCGDYWWGIADKDELLDILKEVSE